MTARSKHELESDVVTVEIPLSALTVFAPPPSTVTQRNCLACFGISKDDFLRMAGSDFPITQKGKLRIAKYADVEAALTGGAKVKEKAPASPAAVDPMAAVDAVDLGAALRKLGFQPKK